MADSVFRPTKPHFFQPILPNFHTQLTIPEAFFVRYLEDKKPRSAVLKSNGGERSWRVKINGRRITDGWKEFVGSQDLRVGDIVLFRLEGRMVFHVTVFGPSGCEKQNAAFNDIMQQNTTSPQETEEESRDTSVKKRAKRRLRTNAAACDKSSFVATVTPSSIKDDRMFFLTKFGRFSGLRNKSGMILLMNKQKRIWKSYLRKKPDRSVYIKGGWRDFCAENNLKVGDLYGFKLSSNARIPILTLMGSDEVLEASRRYLKKNEGSSRSTRRVSCSDEVLEASGRVLKTIEGSTRRASRSENEVPRFLTLTVSSYGFNRGIQYVPKRVARSHGLNRGHDEVTVMDKNGFCWVIKLCALKSTGRMCLGRGWKSFCVANGIKIGDSIRFEMIPGNKLMMRFCSNVKTE